MSRPLSSEYSVELGYSFSLRLGRNLELLRNATLNQDFDCCILVDGKEGSGKSVIAQQIGKFLDVDRELSQEQVVFSAKELKKLILSYSDKPGKAIVWDESRAGLNRRKSTDKVNIEITDMLSETRQFNLFLVVVMPSFYDMDMNIAVWRSRALIHVWYKWNLEERNTPLQRGFFRFYSEEGKKRLYTDRLLREKYSYPYLKNECFDNTFPGFYVVDEAVYRRRKKEAMRSYSVSDNYSCDKCGRKAKKGKSGWLECPLGHKWRDSNKKREKT